MSTCSDVVSREHVPVEMRHEQLDGVVVFRRELDDEVLHRLRLRGGVAHVRRGHEALVELGREQRVGQRAEVVLEDGRDRADVVEAVAVA
jgi:microsomal dipeptidase-like Zn-dependent dipeptidase